MPSIALERSDVIVGVDTHKDQHVAVAIDGLGGVLGEPQFVPATTEATGSSSTGLSGLATCTRSVLRVAAHMGLVLRNSCAAMTNLFAR